jgi:hypothetical protein
MLLGMLLAAGCELGAGFVEAAGAADDSGAGDDDSGAGEDDSGAGDDEATGWAPPPEFTGAGLLGAVLVAGAVLAGPVLLAVAGGVELGVELPLGSLVAGP